MHEKILCHNYVIVMARREYAFIIFNRTSFEPSQIMIHARAALCKLVFCAESPEVIAMIMLVGETDLQKTGNFQGVSGNRNHHKLWTYSLLASLHKSLQIKA